MNRPDLAGLTEEQLAAATSPGLVLRARKELAAGALTAQVVKEKDAARVEWSDGVVCLFPAGSSLRGGRCTCAAVEICRHLIRSILYLQSRAPDAGQGEGTDAKPETASPGPPFDLLSADAQELEARIGKRSLAKARARLAKGLSARLVDPARRLVEFAGGGTVCFPPGADESAVLCDCRTRDCPHWLPALLLLRGERPEIAVPEADAPSAPGRRESLARTRRLLAEIFRGGLDGLSLGWTESAWGTVAELRQSGLKRLSGLLADLTDRVGADATNESEAQSAHSRWLLAALGLEVLGTAGGEPDASTPEHASGGPKRLRLVALACSGWKTDEVVGITLHLLDDETGAGFTVGTGRPIDRGDTFGNLAARVPLLGPHTARDLLGRWVECSAATWSEGRLSLEAGAALSLLPEPVDWEALGARHGIRRFASVRKAFLSRFPTLAWINALAVAIYRPDGWGAAEYSTGARQLQWIMKDDRGEEIPLILRADQGERRTAIDAILSLARRAAPRWVVGRASVRSGRVVLRPLALVTGKGADCRVHHVDLDAGESDRGEADATFAPRRPARDTVFAPCDRWLDEVLALGLASLGAERLSRARMLARLYQGRNLPRLGSELDRLVDLVERGTEENGGRELGVEEAVVRVLIALEMSREAYYLEQGPTGSPVPPTGLGRAAS